MKKKYYSTLNEKLYISFELGKKHQGKENICFKNFKIDGEIIKDSTKDEKNIIELRNECFQIQDDFNDKSSKNRIGTTVVNLLNKVEKLNIDMNECLEKLEKVDKEQIHKICEKLEDTINKLDLRNIDKIVDKFYEIREFSNEKDYHLFNPEYFYNIIYGRNFKELIYFCEQLDLLAKEFVIDKVELNIIVEKLLEEEKDIEEFYFYDVPLRIVEEEIRKEILNKPLQYLLNQAFKDFYHDYQSITDKQELRKFLKVSKEHYSDNPYNTYYRNINKYMNKLSYQYYDEMKEYKKSHEQNKIMPKMFKEFSHKDMAIIFIQSFIDDLKFMKNNYKNLELDFLYINKSISSENEFEISSLGELFYISLYYIKQNGDTLKECKFCKKIFVAQKPTRDKVCQRPSNKANKYKTCIELNDNFREGRKKIKSTSKYLTFIDKLEYEINEIMSSIEKESDGKETYNKYNTKISGKLTSIFEKISKNEILTIEEKKRKLSTFYAKFKNIKESIFPKKSKEELENLIPSKKELEVKIKKCKKLEEKLEEELKKYS